MVTTRFDAERRAQILLVGALAIAFVIVGLAVLFNAVTYTGQTTVPEAGSSIDDASQFDFEARRGARELVLRVNHDGVYGAKSPLASDVAANVSDYSAVMGATYSGHGAAVNVSFENATSDYGRRVVQDQETVFTQDGTDSGSKDWQLVDESDRVGWFAVTVNGTDLAEHSANAFTINVSNDTGEYVEYRIYGKRSGVVNVTVDTSVGSGNGVYQFNTTRGHVVLDLIDGTSLMNLSARMPSIRRLEGTYNVTFQRGDEASGLYSIVVPSADRINGSITDCSTAATPCHGPAIWNATVTTHYRSPSVNVTHNQTVPVYNSTT
ncbi:MAG: hypothetical protein ACOCY7_00150 [Halodesulfurarchaeum sp.]